MIFFLFLNIPIALCNGLISWSGVVGMATMEGVLTFSVASVVEDVLQQHGKRLNDVDLASRKAEEACVFLLYGNLFFFF